MRDVYLWTGLAAVGIGACIVIVVIVSRLFDRQREQRYVPPTALYTEVRAPEKKPEPAPVAIPAPIATPVAEVSGWALDALADVRKAAAEDTYATLGEFARPVPTSPALIWAGMVGRRTVLGLVTA